MRGLCGMLRFAAVVLTAAVNAGVDLPALLPSDTALLCRIDAAALGRDERLRVLLPAVLPETFCGVRREDLSVAVFASDSRTRRMTAAFEVVSDAAWERVRSGLDRYLCLERESPFPLYRLTNAGRDLNGGLWALPAPRVGVLYFPRKGECTLPDETGVPARVRQLLPGDSPLAVCGIPRIKSEPFRSVKSFQAALRSAGGRPVLNGEADFAQPVHAAFGQVALLATFSMWLQEFAGLTPEGAAEVVSRIKVRQQGTQLRFEFSDFELLARMISEAERS